MALTTPLNAANAYGAVSRLANRGAGGQSGGALGDVAGDGGFAEMVRSQIEQVVESGKAAEAKQVDMLQGKADLVDVVTAVSETQLALETMVSVRDKVIAAYEEIMRMPI